MARLKPISLRPLDPEQALAAFLAVKPKKGGKAPRGKKKPAKASQRAKKKKGKRKS